MVVLLPVLGLLVSAVPLRPVAALATDNPVVVENALPGSASWRLGPLVSDDATGQIKGYASATSINPGGTLSLAISVNPAQSYTIDVYRIGWYGGLGARLRLHEDNLQGSTQAPCAPDATIGLIACNWAPTYSLTVPGDWTSGVYLALLTNAKGYQNYVPFVVRDGRPAAFLYQEAVATDQAYNNYPNDGATGKSLYTWNSYGANTLAGDPRAVKVSFDRPYSGSGSGLFLVWEVQLVRWLERSGYDVTYSTDIDTHSNGAALRNSKALLSAGHDEYWSKEMFDAAETARDAGVNLAFFGADSISWQARFEPSAAGVPNRVMVCYRVANLDPVQGPTTTVPWRYAPANRPGQTLSGVEFTSDVDYGGNAPYVVSNSSHWVYAGTGLKDGDSIPGIVGYEMDRYLPAVPAPTALSRILLSASPFSNVSGFSDVANSSLYQAPSGAWVFASGTMSWSWALDGLDHNLADPRIQRATSNLFQAFLYGAPIVHHLQVAAAFAVTAGQAFSVSVIAANAQGNPVTDFAGTVHFSTTDTSSGVLLPADTTLVNGQATFSATLTRAGPQTLTVADAAGGLSTTVSLSVRAAPASQLALTAPARTVAGIPFALTVIARDPFGNTDLAYRGTLHFASSDTAREVALPADARLVNGQGTFSATLVRAGTQTITIVDTTNATLTSTASVKVAPAAAAALSLVVPGSVTANQAFAVGVTLKDRFGNVATGYAGTVHFTTSDLVAAELGKMPADYTFGSADAGAHSFTATLVTVPSQTITVRDTADWNLGATSPSINVNLL